MFFFNFEILIFWFVRGLKGQKISQNGRSFCQSHLIFQNHISYDLHLWYTCMYQRLISPGILKKFFFKFLIFGIIRGGGGGRVKGQKMTQNAKKILSVLLHISGTIHHIVVIFGTRVKWWISSKFFNFSNSDFWGVLGREG